MANLQNLEAWRAARKPTRPSYMQKFAQQMQVARKNIAIDGFAYSVDRMQPKPNQVVLCYGNLKGTVGWHRAKWTRRQYRAFPTRILIGGVTHFMPAETLDGQIAENGEAE
jgi:hypothetical protein